MVTIGKGPEEGQPWGVRDRRRELVVLNQEALFACVWMAWTTGAFQTEAALILGGGDLLIGLLGALPYLGALAMPAASALVDRMGRYRGVTYGAALLARGSWWVGGVLLLGAPRAVSGGWALKVFAAMATVSALALASSNLAWYGWIRGLLPEGIRGRWLGLRAAISNGTMAAAAVGGSAWLALWGRRGGEERTALALLFLVAATVGTFGARLLRRVPEVSLRRPAGEPGERAEPRSLERLVAPLRDRNFRRFILVQFLFVGGMNMAAPFLNAFLLERTGVGTATAAALGMVTPMASLLPYLGWGRAAQRFGNRPVLALSAVVATSIPFGWALVKAHNVVWLVVLLNTVAGFAWAGYNLATANMVLELSPEGHTHSYLALFTALSSLGPTLSPFLSGGILRLVRRLAPAANPFLFIFLVSGMVRLATLPSIRKLREPGATSVRTVFATLSTLEGALSLSGVESILDWVTIKGGEKKR